MTNTNSTLPAWIIEAENTPLTGDEFSWLNDAVDNTAVLTYTEGAMVAAYQANLNPKRAINRGGSFSVALAAITGLDHLGNVSGEDMQKFTDGYMSYFTL